MKFFNIAIPLNVMVLVLLLLAGSTDSQAASAKKHSGPSPTAVQDFAIIRKAISAAKAKKWRIAREYAASFGVPVLSKIVMWMEFTEPGEQSSFGEISEFIRKNPDWPQQDLMWQNAENSLDNSVVPGKIIAWFAEHPPETRNGMIYLALAKKAVYPDNPETKVEYEALIRKAWATGNFNEKEEREFLHDYGQLIREIDFARRIDNLLWEQKIDAAKRIMDKVSKPYQKLFAARMAFIRNRRGAVDLARDVSRPLQENEGLLYDAAEWYYNAKEPDKVRHILEFLPKDLDHAEKWTNIRLDQIRSLISEGKYDQAYHLAGEHGSSEVLDYSEVEWMAGWIALRFQENPDRAYKHFYNLYTAVKTPMSLARAAYWAGRAAEADGKNDLAKNWYDVGAVYPTTFYGQLSALKSGKTAIAFPYSVQPSAEDKKAFDRKEVILAFRTLASIGEDEIAKKFLIAAIKNAKTAGEMRLISRIGINTGHREFSVVAAKQAALRGVIFEDESYPTLTDSSVQNSIEPPLAHAIIRQESMFAKNAQSSAGALGLMQLLPDTARLMAHKLRTGFDRQRLTSDANYNIRLGSYYLRNLINNYDGSYILAICAYNGGEGNVSKWVAMYGDPRRMRNLDNIVDWLEVIPFKETRNYVQRVLEATEVYRYILAKKSAKAGKPEILLEKDLGI